MFDQLHDHDLALDAVEDAIRLVAQVVEGQAGVEEGGLGDDLHRGVLASLAVPRETYSTFSSCQAKGIP